MKKIFHILTAALLLTAGALLTTGCGNDDTAIDNGKDQPAQGRTVMFTATLAPKGDNGGQTRAITKGTKDGKEILNVAWKAGEEIAVYYLKSDGSTHATAKAKVMAVDATTGVATIETVDGYHLVDPQDDSEVQFVYPASLVNETGNDIDENILLNQQNGLLNTGMKNISKNFDAATGSGTISVAAGTAVVSSKVTMHNRVCICKITLDFSTDGSSVISNCQQARHSTSLSAGAPTPSRRHSRMKAGRHKWEATPSTVHLSQATLFTWPCSPSAPKMSPLHPSVVTVKHIVSSLLA